MTEQQKEMVLNYYADGFDLYLSTGRMPDVEGDDLLGQYIRDLIDRNPNLGGSDPDFKESFKENLQSFLGEMLDRFNDIDRALEPEKLLMNQFADGTLSERRVLWDKVKSLTKEKYQPSDLDADGYDLQLNGGNEDLTYEMFAKEWGDASKKRQQRIKRQVLASSSRQWEATSRNFCEQDYFVRLQFRKSLSQYPIIDEIAKIIGRQRSFMTDDTSNLANKYLSSSIAPTPSYEEIDRIVEGNNLERVIPSEFSYLADSDTEMLFMARYVQRQLQQFMAPGNNMAVKDTCHVPQPRQAYGPIIVSVDTSGSMDGQPKEIAMSMLYQLLSIARRENRRCYLITFSVRSRSINLSEPGQWRNLDKFLSHSFSGGTNGEQMLRDAIRSLRTDDFTMADVLIISDFAFALPLPETIAAIRGNQSLGTRFYGLQIGVINNPYFDILDKIWVIN